MNRRGFLAGIAGLLAGGKVLRDRPPDLLAADIDATMRAMARAPITEIEWQAAPSVNLTARKFTAELRISNELLADTDPDELAAGFGDNLAEELQRMITRDTDEHFRRRWS